MHWMLSCFRKRLCTQPDGVSRFRSRAAARGRSAAVAVRCDAGATSAHCAHILAHGRRAAVLRHCHADRGSRGQRDQVLPVFPAADRRSFAGALRLRPLAPLLMFCPRYTTQHSCFLRQESCCNATASVNRCCMQPGRHRTFAQLRCIAAAGGRRDRGMRQPRNAGRGTLGD